MIVAGFSCGQTKMWGCALHQPCLELDLPHNWNISSWNTSDLILQYINSTVDEFLTLTTI